mmetsp:Transcript_67164/g.165756  ORF Transcript_67164/g.165756 Transcript_67164/m.165756 type:complete len:498 (-) Transcript_67164:420-1913(-)
MRRLDAHVDRVLRVVAVDEVEGEGEGGVRFHARLRHCEREPPARGPRRRELEPCRPRNNNGQGPRAGGWRRARHPGDGDDGADEEVEAGREGHGDCVLSVDEGRRLREVLRSRGRVEHGLDEEEGVRAQRHAHPRAMRPHEGCLRNGDVGLGAVGHRGCDGHLWGVLGQEAVGHIEGERELLARGHGRRVDVEHELPIGARQARSQREAQPRAHGAGLDGEVLIGHRGHREAGERHLGVLEQVEVGHERDSDGVVRQREGCRLLDLLPVRPVEHRHDELQRVGAVGNAQGRLVGVGNWRGGDDDVVLDAVGHGCGGEHARLVLRGRAVCDVEGELEVGVGRNRPLRDSEHERAVVGPCRGKLHTRGPRNDGELPGRVLRGGPREAGEGEGVAEGEVDVDGHGDADGVGGVCEGRRLPDVGLARGPRQAGGNQQQGVGPILDAHGVRAGVGQLRLGHGHVVAGAVVDGPADLHCARVLCVRPVDKVEGEGEVLPCINA